MEYLIREIQDFLKRNGRDCNVRKHEGIEIICAVSERKSPPVLPVKIDAEDEKSAKESAERLVKSIGSLMLSYEAGGYPLLVTEDRWRSQPDMIKSRLLAHLNKFTQIYARNCEVRKINKQTAAEFLHGNHSYGYAKCRYRYGLYLKRHTGHNAGSSSVSPGTLVAVATFSNARKWIKGDKTIRSYEWTRYASIAGVRLSGGMGKLLNAFIEEVKPDDIMTYADLEWSEGKVYETLGFVLEGIKEPVMFTIDTESWKRKAITGDDKAPSEAVYFQNLGSNKYRLKLTDYQ